MAGKLLITAPTTDVVTVAECKAMVPSVASADDTALQMLINAAVQTLDPAGGGWLDRALRPQTWELRLDHFPACEIVLPYPPLLSIDSFVYDDAANGDEQTLAVDTDYRIVGAGTKGKQSLRPPYNGAWPSARYDVDTVRIQYTCGYTKPGNAASDTLPAPIKQAIVLMVKDGWGVMERNLFESQVTVDGVLSKEFVVTENATKVMRAAADNLLSTQRIYGF
jgi:uncharacterized phiE125 gp8 family phage protein